MDLKARILAISWTAALIFAAFLQLSSAEHSDDHEELEYVHNTELCEEPLPPLNGELQCGRHKKRQNRLVCKATCDDGFQFPDGKTKRKNFCNMDNGKWNEFVIPDCDPICNPPCENAGRCDEENNCVCAVGFRGKRCEYSYGLCDPSQVLDVAGSWKCNHTSSETQCVLNCPQGTQFETQPADLYRCSLEGVWTPNFAPKCLPINIIEPPSSPGMFPSSTGLKHQTVSSDMCATWSQLHYRTYDGGMYSFQGKCTYLLSKDCSDGTFAIHVDNSGPCDSPTNCQNRMIIYVGNEEYVLTDSPSGPVIVHREQTYAVPSSIGGMIFQFLSDYPYVSLTSSLGFRLMWNSRGTVLLKLNNQMKNKTCGLCGRFDGSVLNDFEMADGTITDNVEAFVNSWTMNDIESQCPKGAIVEHPCNSVERSHADAATEVCEKIKDPRFSACHYLVNPQPYYEACRMDYCACSEPNHACVCNSFEEYFRECGRLGGKVEGGWRTEQLCPRNCPGNMIYEDCGSSCPLTCRNTVYNCEDEHCVGGCHCPEGTVLHQTECIPRTICPCTHNGKDYEHGARITQECNACECLGGKWECTKETCEARCSSTGDPHYTTFDGVQYEFLGSCPYYLMYHENFTIIQENGPCLKSHESTMEGEHSAESAFCTHSITVNYEESVLVLKPNTQPIFNDKGINSYPFTENGLKIDVASSMFIKVELSYGVSLMWDGKNRIYIDVSPSLYGKTKGLCGTFNQNQNDDFVTPDGDVEADVSVFASRWKASDACHKRARRMAVPSSSCSTQPQKLPDAKHLCNLIKSEVFEVCHNEVDPEPFYRRCVEDLCACNQDLEECLCDSLSDYGAACARIGTVLDWAQNIAACMPRCENGQVYQECGNPCKSSCLTIATAEYCQESCVQGCACPDGMTLNSDGFCIPINQCPCVYENKEYTAKSAKLQGTSMCECVNAEWVCHPASLNELVHLGNDMMTLGKSVSCDEKNNEEFTQCLSSCRPACQNLRLQPDCLTLDCKAGCKCKDGYVFDEDLEKCVKLSECGCRHGHRKYSEKSKIQKDCNLCSCEQGAWICTEKVCPGICTVWGESHYKTFDGRIFDFHGDCDYVLAKTALEVVEFSLRVRNVPCGTSGITCSKSFTLDLGNGDKVTLSRDEPLPKSTYGSRLLVSDVGLFISVYTEIGITLRWDKGTRMYITVDPQWQGKITGLCGNFNNDQSDDFLSPFGGIPEARPILFADSWKVEETCSASKTIDDACSLHPERQGWAIQKCSILKSDLFSACHSEVALQPFFERCVFDTCACDIGGDCECLCTSIAAYAQECNVHGVHIKWRTQELCPIQCEECAVYESCMSSCPVRTCDTQLIYENIDCSYESCIEGCNPKPCPPGQIFNNARELQCIPQVDCVIPCREINGKMYYEGERITDPDVVDNCQSCHCLRGTISCSGQPCPTTTPIIPLPPAECEQTGWTPWLNTPKIIGGDFENLNSIALFNVYSDFCGLDNITDIECRVTESKVPYKETGQTVTCSLPNGLVCKDELQNSELCEDYEIRLFCNCGPLTTIATATESVVVVPSMCQAPGWTYWMNAYVPDEKGDFETIRNLRKSRIFCPDNEIDDIECRKAGTRKQYDEQDPHIKCDKDIGMECVNTGDYRCDDYEIRFYCVCSYTECDYPRGMKNGNIKPSQILVSSYRTESTNGNSGRVNGQSAWSTSNVEQSQWIQVDLEEEQEITGVYTQGSPLAEEWVTAFKISYSHDGSRFFEVKDITGNVQVFKGNDDRNTPVYNTFATFFARYVRLIPLEWHNWISLRVELLGCVRNKVVPRVLIPQECRFPGWTNWFNSYSADSKGDFETKNHIMWSSNVCPENEIEDIQCRSATTGQIYDSEDPHIRCNIDTGLICMNTNDYNCDDYEIRFYCKCSDTECDFPRGMERGQIKDSQILVSSFWMEETDGRSSRLNGKSAWRPGNLEFEQWIQVDLKEQQEITGIVTQGNPAEEEWVTLYKVSYSDDDVTFSFFKDLEGNPQIFTANEDSGTAVPNVFSPIYARYIRIVPVEWHKWIGLRFEILGCNRKAPLTTTPTVPSCIPGWTDYFNVDTPENEGDGDEETIEMILKKHHNICTGGNVQKAECATYQEGKLVDYMKTGQIGLKCSSNAGFICINSIQNRGEKCHDYMIRFYCSCEEITTPPIFITETTTPTTTTTEITTTISPCPPGEVYDHCAYHCGQTCLSFLSVLHKNGKCFHEDEQCIEGCRSAHGCDHPHLWRDFATCVPRDECTCVLPDGTQLAPKQVVQLKECEKCQCVDNSLLCLKMPQCVTVVPEGHNVSTTPGYITNIENEDCWTDWINIDSPDTDVGDLEVLSKIRNKYEFCSNPVEIECRRADNKQKASDSGQNVRCELLRGLHCWTSENEENGCYDYEIRFFCPCVTVPPSTTMPTSTTLPPSTVPPAPCEHEWTEWFNKHVPGSIGEYETIQSIRAGGGYFCSSDMITAIECRKTSGPEPYTLQHKVICHLEVGLMCKNSDLNLDESCSDYEVRFFCDCPTSTVTTTPRQTTTTITPTITTIPAVVPCSHWSDWINENHPDGTALGKGPIKKGSNKSKGSNGDVEKRTLFRLQQEDRFCLEGELTDIECRTAETDLDFTQSDDLKLACTLPKGFRCRSKDQRNGVCQDYKIRYFCTCKEITITSVIITTSTLPPPPCSSYYDVVDGPFPLPDSNLKASTSRDSSSGPQNARLSSVQGLRSSGAWIAGTLDLAQYLEIDLGKIQPVYGVVTKGRAGTDEWVKSYYVLFSRDGVTFSYVHEEPDFKIKKEFPGNYDGDSPVKHVFAKPFEAQYVQIHPVTFNREIALRADVLGCAEGFTTTKATTTPITPICTDEMGMENGNISDSQITVSSVRGPNSGAEYIRLNTIQLAHHTGGWVANIVDENQHVQIDFLEPRTITGIITQGRELAQQWVESYKVLYSQDGVDWNVLTDEDGNPKVFRGNFDSDTTVKNFFPRAIRTRYMRIVPLTWNNWISMRLEVLGCFEPYPIPTIITVSPTICYAAICETDGSSFNTFDGYGYYYEICDHVLMKSTSGTFSVEVHKECPGMYGKCFIYIVVNMDGHNIRIGPAVDEISIDGDKVLLQNLWFVENIFPDIKLNITENEIMLHSKTYDTSVSMNSAQGVKISVSSCSSFGIAGLCGNSNGDIFDDQQMPNGSLATSITDFGDSWSKGDMSRCVQEECPPDILREAKEDCEQLKNISAFHVCASFIDIQSRIKDCIDNVCDCSPRLTTTYVGDSCMCQDFQKFVDECEIAADVSLNGWKYETGCEERVKEFSTVPPTIFTFKDCFSLMGFENGLLPDSFISVSSFSSPETDASRIRLGTKPDENGAGGWTSLPLDKSPYVLIDFHDVRNVTGIITQGRSDADMWVTSYTVQYSLDNLEWKYCTNQEDESITFSGNRDRSSILVHRFAKMVEARFVKVTVVDYHESPAMRMELLGCFEPYVQETTTVTITTTEFCIEYSQWISLSEPSLTVNEEEPIGEIIQHFGLCSNPLRIQCRTVVTKTDYTKTGQNVICDLTHGLLCKNDEQPSGYCKNYEVRIGCWTCVTPVTTTLHPLVLCPETPLSLMERCPVSCPPDHACDGTSCIHHIDCPCFQEEKRFNASDRMVTSDCNICDCILEGHSKCKPITCPDCLEGQKSELTKDCKCICTGCPIGTELCPTNGQCLESKLWCDGIVDCPDDEVGCPTTTVSTTTTTVTSAPPTCSPEMQLETVTCEMTANLFSTFDGLEYQYDICNHVLMKDKEEEMFEVTVHKECLPDQRTCSRYVELYVDGTEIKLGPGAKDLHLDGYKIPIGNLWFVTKRFPNFVFRKEGNNLVVSSLQYNFTVTWDPRQDARITMPKCITRNVAGLCGFYNGNYDDDRLKPDGSLASGNEEFGNSWSIGDEEYCIPPKCPIDIMTLAQETCKELSGIPFSNCSSYLNTESQTAACMSYMCECLQKESEKTITDSAEMCKCNAYESFVEACEKSSNGHRIEWRLKYGCAPVCPPGMEWHECGPGCELTCDNYRSSEEICSDQCIPGCYCPSGLVRHRNKCIKPKLCQDCVCRGHGDPNYITFDGHYYAFQGNCTYVLAQHQTLDKLLDFQVLGINIECPEEPHTSCTDGIKIIWNGHTLVKFKDQPVTLDGTVMKAKDFPYEDELFTISYVPRKNMVVHVKDINLVVRYFDQIYAFNVELPSYVYFNQTEGLCGICNFIESDDMYHKDGYTTDNVDDFAYSWLVENTRDECTLPRVPVLIPPEPKICNFTRNRCELFMDPMFYSKACMNDITYSTNAKASMCRSKIQYAQQCCEKGISLTEWLHDSGCLLSCDEGMSPECSTSCQRTCNNYKDYDPNDCSLSPLLTCNCPPDKVFQFGKCVDPQVCEICDDEGHVVADEWDNGPCEHCTCLENRIVRCHVQTCAEPPICTEEEKLEVLPQHEAACCPIYRCIPIPKKPCPSAPIPDCQPGQVVKVSIVDDCQVYECACDEKLCPPLVHPTSVEEGEEFLVVQKGCCQEYESQCIPENCHDPVKCGPGFKLSTFEGKCCTKSTCIAKKNVCVYHHQFEVVNGTEFHLSPEQYFDKEYEAGSSWNDGLCRRCSCVESDNQFSYKCTIEICPDPSQFPDADIYQREKEDIPGMCCPTYHRVQCVSEGVKYSVNEEWPSPDGNKCKKFRCIESSHGEVTRLEKTTICNVNCPEYAVYVEPDAESPLCCGYCKPVGCDENGKIYKGGDTWKSETKPCFTGECIISENMTQIMYRSEKCPPFPSNCPPKDVIFDATGCCQLCKKEPEIRGVCAPSVIPELDTRQFFLISDEVRGICSNYREVKNLTVCSGKCGSDLVYSKERDDFESKCKCCIPDNIVKREITLDCDDRSQIKKIYQQPTSCHCSSCGAEEEIPFVGPVVY